MRLRVPPSPPGGEGLGQVWKGLERFGKAWEFGVLLYANYTNEREFLEQKETEYTKKRW
jgi:hypothetical protein